GLPGGGDLDRAGLAAAGGGAQPRADRGRGRRGGGRVPRADRGPRDPRAAVAGAAHGPGRPRVNRAFPAPGRGRRAGDGEDGAREADGRTPWQDTPTRGPRPPDWRTGRRATAAN